jgi:hypothetical protein
MNEALKQFTDDELLLELRQRGRLARLEVNHKEKMAHLRNIPPSYIWERMWRDAAAEANYAHGQGRYVPSGSKMTVTEVHRPDEVHNYTLILNYVVDKE